jgi:hypothetical protein
MARLDGLVELLLKIRIGEGDGCGSRKGDKKKKLSFHNCL